MARKQISKEEIQILEKEIQEMDQIMMQESKLRKGTRDSIPSFDAWPALNNNNNPYHAYRFGVALAGAPAGKMEKEGPIGGNFLTISYTDADSEILKSAAKQMGVSKKGIGSKKSTELPDVHKSSPTAKIKKNRYGI